jgi:hypothetical protein
MRSFINQAIAMSERIERDDNSGRIGIRGGDPDLPSTSQESTPKQKVENAGKGKGASDKPTWQSPPEANLSNFTDKKGKGKGKGKNKGSGGREKGGSSNGNGSVGTRPFVMQETCPIHGKAVDHSPMECRQTLENKKRMAAKNRVCFNCCGTGHMASKCFTMKACESCPQSHHPMFCPKNQKVPSSNGGSDGKGRGKGKWNNKKGSKPQGKKGVSFAADSDSDDVDEKYSVSQGMSIVSKKNGANTSASGNST